MSRACPGGSTGPSRAPLRLPRGGCGASRGSLPWTTWTSPSTRHYPQQPGVQFFLSPRVQFRMSFDTQADVAERLGRPQSFVAKYEGGERRLDVIEFVEVAEALETDPRQLLRDLLRR